MRLLFTFFLFCFVHTYVLPTWVYTTNAGKWEAGRREDNHHGTIDSRFDNGSGSGCKKTKQKIQYDYVISRVGCSFDGLHCLYTCIPKRKKRIRNEMALAQIWSSFAVVAKVN